jgi:FMN phosphatase YigB (HAD superfamily)
MTDGVVFMFDVDNTLIDNDAIIADLRMHLVKAFGPDCEQRYWEIFEQCRRELGYADYLGALQRYRLEQPHDLHVLRVSLFLLDYPFARRLCPRALDVIAAVKTRGHAIILSDGDVVFQPRKVERSGLWAAVDGNVLIYVHKEQMLGDMQRRYPARRYVMVDDKLRLLRLMKAQLGERLTTVFVRQGHYAHDPHIVATEPPADVQIDAIADLLTVNV